MEIRGYDRLAATVIAVTLLGVSGPGLAQQQAADPDFPTRVQRPAFVKARLLARLDITGDPARPHSQEFESFQRRERQFLPIDTISQITIYQNPSEVIYAEMAMDRRDHPGASPGRDGV